MALCTGTRVTLHGLQARPELNGKTGRVLLKRDAETGRCGVVLDDGDSTKPLAVKPNNLEPLPFVTDSPDGTVRTLLDLPAELLECVLSHLSARSLLRASAACAALNSVRGASGTAWNRLLAHPLVAPYNTSPRAPPEECLRARKAMCGVPWPLEDEDGEASFRRATRRRARWLDGSMSSVRSNKMLLSFDRFVRSVAVDFDSLTIAVGLSSGQVACARVNDRPGFRAPFGRAPAICSLQGERHEEQVVAVALHAPSGLIVSGCGTPGYPVSYTPGPYRATIKVWRATTPGAGIAAAAQSMEGELVHTLEGHTEAVRQLILLDGDGDAPPTYAASGDANGVVIIWDVRAGRQLRTLVDPEVAGRRPAVGSVRYFPWDVVGLVQLPESLRPHSGDGGGAPGVQGRLLLSADRTVTLRVFDWHTGQLLRILDGFTQTIVFDTLSSIALHAPTGVLALGQSNGWVALVALLPNRREPPFWAALGSTDNDQIGDEVVPPQRGDDRSVVCMQLDEDKLVTVGRGGKLLVSALRRTSAEFSEGRRLHQLKALLAQRAHDEHCFGLAPADPTDLMSCARDLATGKVPKLDGPPLNPLGVDFRWQSPVRFYVSSVCYRGGVIVHDGLDDSIMVSFCDE